MSKQFYPNVLCVDASKESFSTSQQLSDLQDFRLQETLAFTTVGIDNAEPLLVKSEGNSKNKVWICLFSCNTCGRFMGGGLRETSMGRFWLQNRFVSLPLHRRILSPESEYQASLKRINTKKSIRENYCINKRLTYLSTLTIETLLESFCERIFPKLARVSSK